MTPLATRPSMRIVQRLTAAFLLALVPAMAAAQEGEVDTTGRGRIGPLGLTPRIGWQTEYDDNVYRTITEPVTDIVSTASFSTDIRSRARRVGVTGSAEAEWMHFATLQSERGANVGTALKVDFLLNRVMPYVSTSHLTSRRRLNRELDARVRMNQSSIGAGTVVRVGAKTSLDLSAGEATSSYAEDALADGVNVSDALDRTTQNVMLSFIQDVTPLTRLTATSEMRRDLFGASTRRSADYMRFTTGFESTGKLTGHARVGVRILKPHDRLLPESRGLYLAVGTRTTVVDRLQISVDAERDLAPSYRSDITYYESYGYGLGLSYAMRRALRVSVTADRRYADYRVTSSPISATEADLELLKSYGSGITYSLGTSVSFNVSGTYIQRTSSFVPRQFDGMSLRAGVSHAF
jgi:putative beta-barrel porin BBP2